MLGKLLSMPIRLANAPLRAVERIVSDEENPDHSILSAPLEALARSVDEATEADRGK